VGATAVVLLLAGCGLRLETPEPDPLVPDDLEILRADTAADAADLRDRATEAGPGAPPEVAAVLRRVAEASDAHHEAFGGTYVPFPGVTPPPSPTPTVTVTTAPPPPATPDDVLSDLVEGAAEARADAEAVADGPMARLLAAVSVNRSLLADALATALGTVAGPTVTFVVPETVPDGLATQEVAVLVQSEDATGLAWEVTAARSVDAAQRDLAAARATTHRDRAQAWAEAAGIAGTGTDPRRSSYTLPEALGDLSPAENRLAALGEVEAELATSYMSLVAQAEVDARGVLIDAVLDTLRIRVSGDAAAMPDFPALPEQDG
jgi:hypothetical protein